jgi:hypothetical protein
MAQKEKKVNSAGRRVKMVEWGTLGQNFQFSPPAGGFKQGLNFSIGKLNHWKLFRN